jgi:hypothetical protein
LGIGAELREHFALPRDKISRSGGPMLLGAGLTAALTQGTWDVKPPKTQGNKVLLGFTGQTARRRKIGQWPISIT